MARPFRGTLREVQLQAFDFDKELLQFGRRHLCHGGDTLVRLNYRSIDCRQKTPWQAQGDVHETSQGPAGDAVDRVFSHSRQEKVPTAFVIGTTDCNSRCSKLQSESFATKVIADFQVLCDLWAAGCFRGSVHPNKRGPSPSAGGT